VPDPQVNHAEDKAFAGKNVVTFFGDHEIGAASQAAS